MNSRLVSAFASARAESQYTWGRGDTVLYISDPLLGNDYEISNYTTVVTRQWPVNSSRRSVLSLRSVPRCYKQVQLVVALSASEELFGE